MTALDATGDESAPSGATSANTWIPAPLTIGAAPASDWEVNLLWGDPVAADPGEDGFRIEKSIDHGTTFTHVADVAPNATGYTVGGLEPGTDHEFRVSTLKGGQQSPDSVTAVVTTTDTTPWTTERENDGSTEDVVPFGNGTGLSSGFYRVEYVEGALDYTADTFLDDWTVNYGGQFYFGVVYQTLDEDGNPQQVETGAPGTNGHFEHVWQVEAASAGASTGVFYHAGGIIGTRLHDYETGNYSGGVTWRLVRVPVLPTVSISGVKDAAEAGFDNERYGRFKITRSGGDLLQPLEVDMHRPAGTAQAPYDFITFQHKVTFQPNQTEITFDVMPYLDAIAEGPETMVAYIKGAATYLVGAAAQLALVDDARDYTIKSADIRFMNTQGVKKDSGDLYNASQWIDNDGKPLTTAATDSEAPVSVMRNTAGTPERKLTVFAEFKADRALPVGDYFIKGVGTGLGEGEITFETENGAAAVVIGDKMTAVVVADRALPDTIDFGDLQIEWTITQMGNNAQTVNKAYGTTVNRVYVTGGEAPNEYETVLKLGSNAGTRGKRFSPAAGSAATNKQLIDAIWAEFKDREVKTADDKTVLTFWGDANVVRRNDVRDTAKMLRFGHGSCGAWADFLVRVLKAQGITGARASVIKADRDVVDPMMGPPGNVPAGWQLQLSGIMKDANAGQGTQDPSRIFLDTSFTPAGNVIGNPGPHVIVTFAGAGYENVVTSIYDPSYGGDPYEGATRAEAERKWENASLEGWVFSVFNPKTGQTAYDGPNGEPRIVPHKVGPNDPRETKFSP
ncbi:MAG: Calx-beta domain-containing protein [Tepidisphaeraceae bacterium]